MIRGLQPVFCKGDEWPHHEELMNTPRPKHIGFLFRLALTSILGTGVAHADFTLEWSTVDGGGGFTSSGGTYTVDGTAGQPDANAAHTGGVYQVNQGGFWQPFDMIALSGVVWRDNGSGGGVINKENGIQDGTEPRLSATNIDSLGEAGYVVILDGTNTLAAIAAVCVRSPPGVCEMAGQLQGQWNATVPYGAGYTAYVTDAAHRPDPYVTVTPFPVAPAGLTFTKPNTDNTLAQGSVPNGILSAITPINSMTLNFGLISNSCAIPPTP